MIVNNSTPPVEALPLTEASTIDATVTLNPEQPKAGESTEITFTFSNTDGTPVDNLTMHHERYVHALLVSRNLGSIGHLHPEDFSVIDRGVVESGKYMVAYTFPEAGKYIVGVDVETTDDTSLSKRFIVNVGGSPRMASAVTKNLDQVKCFGGYLEDGVDRYASAVIASDAETACPEGYRVTFTPSVDNITAGEEVQLGYHIEKDGMPVHDLQPYLGAAIHLAIVSESLDTMLHQHGDAAVDESEVGDHTEESADEHMEDEGDDHHGAALHDEFGPNLMSERIVFPEAGLYQVFGAVKHQGQIIFTNFMVEVGESFDVTTAKTIDLVVSQRSLDPGIVTLSEGDKAIFRIQTDEDGKFHIAGYEIEKEMNVGSILELKFTADQPGRYNIELHPDSDSDADLVIGALVVNPR